MGSIIFLVVGLIQLGIAIKGAIETKKHFSWYAVLILIVVFGLSYDNIVISIGSLIGKGDLLKALNWPRYAIHALFTPAMMIAAFGALRRGGVKFAQSKLWHGVICSLATVLILFGSYIDILKLNLVPVMEDGILRYVNDFELMKGPPIPAVITIIVVVIFGVFSWRTMKWPWLFVGAVLMFAAAGMMSMPVFQNIGEIAFAAGLVFTEIKVSRDSA